MTHRLLHWTLPVVLLLTAPGCGPASSNGKSLMSDRSDSAAILNRIELILPAAARIEYSAYEAGMDDMARVLVVTPEPEWRVFLRDITRRAPRPAEFLTDNNFMLGAAIPGWDPPGTRGIKTGQLAWKNETEALNVGYAPAGAGRVRVFPLWHQL